MRSFSVITSSVMSHHQRQSVNWGVMLKHNINLHQAIGTAVAVGWPLALAGTVGYIVAGAGKAGLPEWSAGFVCAPAVAWIVVASMAMAPVGARVAHRTSGRTLKRIFAVVLFLLATHMLVASFA